MRSTCLFARTVAACCLAGGAGAAWSQADTGALEVTQTSAAALAPAALSPLHADMATQTMLWRQRGAFGIGIGVEQRNPDLHGPGLQARNGDAVLLGVSLATSERTRLLWQTTTTDHANTPLADRPMKLSLTFQSSDALRELRRGSLLRMELSGQTTLALKARGGRLGFALTSRW
jgi:hypothetical protein